MRVFESFLLFCITVLSSVLSGTWIGLLVSWGPEHCLGCAFVGALAGFELGVPLGIGIAERRLKRDK